ncbi:AAA family ATPase [Shewanella yunxiaonensis]|uniref:AAA family ATPase n=1 Tax=Shewanella yunxiaonensis TaxID=2829809 RepID=A0ABX7YTS7_9GAMM|nr:AAA family ATPase [Shewanella yunxiaonensis]QUN05586.1 AAA family ATPase [Shewanella yunxiaonensis]
MYLQHFGMHSMPFALTPNTEFFFGLAPHVEALQVLQVALQTGEGFIKVTGEVGTGKTLICRKLLNELSDEFVCAWLPNPYLSPEELRAAVAQELGIVLDEVRDQLHLTGLIQQQLLALSAQDKKIVLILDEAQALPDDSLEALRLFTNLETEQRKLVQVVLFGQPELDQRLAQPAFRQLRQRITFSYQLRPLQREEVCAYLRHRLAVSGYQGRPLFSPRAQKLLAQASRGIPRLINVLAHKALLLSYGAGLEQVSDKHLRAAIADTEDATHAPDWRWLWTGTVVLVLLVAVGLLKGVAW